jgi:transposase
MPKSYSPEFRRKVLDLLKAGRPVAEVASDLGVTAASIYVWRKQELIDTGVKPGTTTTENAELRAARRRIADLETELAVTKRANELLKEVVPPKGGTRPSL